MTRCKKILIMTIFVVGFQLPVYASNNYTLEYSTIQHDGPAGVSINYDTRERVPLTDLTDFLSGSVDYAMQSPLSSGSMTNAMIEVWQDGEQLVNGVSEVGFGSTGTNTAPHSRLFTVFNLGTTDLFSGPINLPGGYVVSEGLASSVGAGQSDDFTITLSNDTIGTYTGALQFNHNDQPEDPFVIYLSGVVVAPAEYTLQYASLGHDGTQLIAVNYSGEDALPFNGGRGVLLTSLNYQFVPPGVSMPVGAAAIAVRHDGQTLTNGASTVNFGTVGQGSAGPSETLDVGNGGSLYLIAELTSVPGGFEVSSASAVSVPPAQERAFVLQLDTSSIGTLNGTLQIASNDADQTPFSVQLTGKVVAVIWVDFDWNGAEHGTQAEPYDTFNEGVTYVPTGGIVRMVAGNTPQTGRYTKAMRLEASGGHVRIGAN